MITTAHDFGREVQQRRQKLALTQDELAARSGVNRRFIIELEQGKETCQLGKALTVAAELGLGFGMPAQEDADMPTTDEANTNPDDPLACIPQF